MMHWLQHLSKDAKDLSVRMSNVNQRFDEMQMSTENTQMMADQSVKRREELPNAADSVLNRLAASENTSTVCAWIQTTDWKLQQDPSGNIRTQADFQVLDLQTQGRQMGMCQLLQLSVCGAPRIEVAHCQCHSNTPVIHVKLSVVKWMQCARASEAQGQAISCRDVRVMWTAAVTQCCQNCAPMVWIKLRAEEH